jgi:cytochrome c2
VLFAVSTTNKLALLGALLVYVGFALAASMLVPRWRPGFPGKQGVRLFAIVSLVLFAGMIGAVVAFARENPGPPRPSTEAAATTGASTTTPTTGTGATTATASTAAAAASGNAAHGRQLASSLGCSACHSLDGSPGVGPTWKGLAGSKVTLSDGSTVTADASYLMKAIRDPDAQIVKGYSPGIMSASIKPGSVSVQDAQDLIAFIQQLK